MRKVVLFGASGGGQRLFNNISTKYDVIAFLDNDRKKWGNMLYGKTIYSPDYVFNKFNFEYVIITSAPGMESIKKQCIDMGIEESRIITQYIEHPLESRRIFLERFSEVVIGTDAGLSCAEAGVFEGDFAKYINEYFPNRNLHLFDTFEGFAKEDIDEEGFFSNAKEGDYNYTTVDMVMKKMPYPNKCIVHKGYFPNTAKEVEDQFIFVNLDLDLYLPTYNGLIFFDNKIDAEGIILVHDYFADNFKGPKAAVDRFLSENPEKYRKLPIGDGISIALMKR